jgi:hypothetical protein
MDDVDIAFLLGRAVVSQAYDAPEDPSYVRTPLYRIAGDRLDDNAMSVTGLDVFDATLYKTNTWLNDLMRVLS